MEEEGKMTKKAVAYPLQRDPARLEGGEERISTGRDGI